MNIRLPRPLWIAVGTIAVIVLAVGLRIGVPIYRQQAVIAKIIQHADISDVGLRHLGALPSLNRLFLYQTRATTAGMLDVKRALPTCNVSMVTP